MKCHRDNAELVEITLEKKSCKRCPECGGHFVGVVGPKVKGLSLSSAKPIYDRCVPNGEEQIASPATGKPMQRYIYKGVKLDFCKETNAIWMDAGELETITTKAQKDAKAFKSKTSQVSSSSTSSFSVLDSLDVVDVVGSFLGGAVESIFDAF